MSNTDQFTQLLYQKTLRIGEIEVAGNLYPYRVINKDLAPKLPFFVGLTQGFLFISEEVPPKFRQYPLEHEVYCNLIFKGQNGRCLRALKQELAKVPAEIREQYIKMRREFFKALVRYYQTSKDQDFKPEIMASLGYLCSLSK